MKQAQAQIHEFMVRAQQETPDHPMMPTSNIRALRLKLIAEELMELANAFGFEIEVCNRHGATDNVFLEQKRGVSDEDLVEAYDAILDLLVVTIGSSTAIGLEVEPGWQEVHDSNMSKFIDGHRRDDGKWIKGPSYRPANLKPIIQAQTAEARARAKQLNLPS